MQDFTTRDVALRAIGRAVVNFQKLECCLKVLCRLQDWSGPMSQLEGKVRNRIDKTTKFTMGSAVADWLRIARKDGAQKPLTADLFEQWVSVSYGPFLGPEQIAEHEEALNSLAIERNNLIHHELANFDFTSEEACRELLARLDKQNVRILEQLAILTPAIKALIEWGKLAKRPEIVDELYAEFVRLNSGFDSSTIN